MSEAPSARVVVDSLANLVTGLGTTKDKSTQSFFYRRRALPTDVVDALYATNWLGGKVVDIPADDATREWRQWKAEKPVIEDIEQEERRLKVRQSVNLALKLARKDGGSAILLGTGDDPAVPLDTRTIRKGGLQFLHVVSRWELGTGALQRDPRSPFFRQPVLYQMPLPDGATLDIHPSRVVPFIGVPRADQRRWEDPWGDSIFERLHDAIRDAITSSQTVASLLHEAKVDVIKIPGLTANVTRDDYRSAVLLRFGLAMTAKAVNNSLLLDAEEEWEQKQLHFQGLPEVINALLQIVAGAADMPVTRLLGRSPSGMNATGDADLEAHYTMVRAGQETHLRPALERLDDALVRSAVGRRPRGIYFEWRSLWSTPEKEKAETEHKRAMAVESYARAGIFKPEALQEATVNQLEEDGFLPGIGEAARAHPGVTKTPTNSVQPAAAKPAAKPGAKRPSAPKPGK